MRTNIRHSDGEGKIFYGRSGFIYIAAHVHNYGWNSASALDWNFDSRACQGRKISLADIHMDYRYS